MEAKVIKIVDEYKLAINKGKSDGVKKDDAFMIFEKGEELFDPDTNKSLGFLEIPKLKMKVFNLQKNLTLLESDETTITTDRRVKKTIKKHSGGRSNVYKHLSMGTIGNLRNMLDGINDDEVETIIEEEPKKRLISIEERDIKINNIARKL